MSAIYPFRALRPAPKAAAAVASVPGIRSVKVVRMPAAGQLPNWLAVSTAAGRLPRG